MRLNILSFRNQSINCHVFCTEIMSLLNFVVRIIDHLTFIIYFMFYQITRLLAGKPAFRIDLSKQAKEIVSELSMVIYLLHFLNTDNRVV